MLVEVYGKSFGQKVCLMPLDYCCGEREKNRVVLPFRSFCVYVSRIDVSFNTMIIHEKKFRHLCCWFGPSFASKRMTVLR